MKKKAETHWKNEFYFGGSINIAGTDEERKR